MKLNKLFLLLLPLSLVACNNSKEPEKPDPSLLTTPLCMTCTSDANMGVVSVSHLSFIPEDDFSLQYSKDNKTWYDVEFNELQIPFILKKDETIYFRGDNPEGFNSATKIEGQRATYKRLTTFAALDGDIDIGGNVMSLISSTDFADLKELPNDFCFIELFTNFLGRSRYNNASKLSLPATKLTNGCYFDMFGGNSQLTVVPKLSATTLAEDCYSGMFQGCSLLEKVEVSFDKAGFEKDAEGLYLYTSNWLMNAGTDSNNPTFIWPDGSTIERSDSTVPSGWEIEVSEVC